MKPVHRNELRTLRALTRAGQRRRQGALLLEGVRSIEAALSHQGYVSMLVFDQEGTTDHNKAQALIGSAEAQGVPVRSIPTSELSSLSDTVTPPGVMAIARWQPSRFETTEEALQQLRGLSPRSLLLLDAISDPGNLGTLLRTAAGFGIQGVALGQGCVEVTNPKVVRSAAGTLFALPWVGEELRLPELLVGLEDRGLIIYRAEAGGGEPPERIDPGPGQSWALLLGSEAHGLRPELRSFGTAVHLPLHPGAESLNAAVAGSILLYLLSRLSPRV